MDNYNKAYNAYLQALKRINVKENEQIVLESKTVWSYAFAKDISGANIEEHFKVVYNFGEEYWLNLFIKYVNYKNTKVEEWLFYI